MKTKHTHGEWTNTGLEIRHKSRGIILATIYSHLASNQPQDEANANAKLIAAAPDLLEAIQEILGHTHDGNFLKSIRDQAKKAIKKATE